MKLLHQGWDEVKAEAICGGGSEPSEDWEMPEHDLCDVYVDVELDGLSVTVLKMVTDGGMTE